MGPHCPQWLRSISLLLAIASLSLASPSSGQPSEEGGASDSTAAPRYVLDPVIVTGERVPLPLTRVPLDVSVIDRDRLETARAFFLSDVLREVPAIDVQRSGSLGKLTDVRLRGADPRHTLVLFDGIPLNGPWLGSFDFADVSDPGLTRVEVVGGPSSSLYGSGAVGGVIHLLTSAGAWEGREGPSPARVRAFAEYGEGSTLRQGGGWSGSLGRTQAGIAATHLTSDGVGPRDGYEGWSGNASGELSLGASDRLRVSAIGTDGEKEIPFGFFFDPSDFTLKQVRDPDTKERDRLLAGRATWTHDLGPRAALEAEVAGLTGGIEYENGLGGVSPGDFQRTDLKNTRGIGAARARVMPSSNLLVVMGADYKGDQVNRDDEFSSGGFGDTTEVEEGIHARSLFAQAHWEAIGRVLLDAGVRLEDHSRYGAHGVPRLALGLHWKETGLKLRGGYGRAFTAPTLTDLHYPGYGSDSLRPERSTTWEAGADGRWLDGRIEAHATLHTTRFHDLIQSNSFFVADNVGEARIEGEEYSVRIVPVPRLKVSLGAAHLVAKRLSDPDPGNPDPDRRLAKRPAWRFGITGEARATSEVTLTGAWRWVDSVRDPFVFVDADGLTLDGDTPGYAALDLGVIASLKRWVPIELHVGVTNVLDREYSEVKGFPARERAATAGITFFR